MELQTQSHCWALFFSGSWKGYLFVGEGIMHQSAVMRPPCVNGEGVVEGPMD